MHRFTLASQLHKYHVEAAKHDIATDGKVRTGRRASPCPKSIVVGQKNSRIALLYMANGKPWDSVKIAELVGGKTKHFSHVMRKLARLDFAEFVGSVPVGNTRAKRYRLTEAGMRVAMELQAEENVK